MHETQDYNMQITYTYTATRKKLPAHVLPGIFVNLTVAEGSKKLMQRKWKIWHKFGSALTTKPGNGQSRTCDNICILERFSSPLATANNPCNGWSATPATAPRTERPKPVNPWYKPEVTPSGECRRRSSCLKQEGKVRSGRRHGKGRKCIVS